MDVRTHEDFTAVPPIIPGSVRMSHLSVPEWARNLAARQAVVICQNGRELSEGVAAWLRHHDVAAEALEGGYEAWSAAGLPTMPTEHVPPRDEQVRSVWVTRARPKIDRIACPWLIRRFVDPQVVSCSSLPGS